MGNLVLKTRVAVARRNLQRVRDMAATLESRENSLGEFLSSPEKWRDEIGALWKRGWDLIPLAKEFQNEDPQLFTDLNGLVTQLNQLGTEVERMSGQARRLREELSKLTGHRKDVDDYLILSARQLEATLTEDNFYEKRAKVDALFSEYVELLHGIALRSAGFGDAQNQLGDLFLIADQLPSMWRRVEGWSWQSLAVPSMQERKASTEAMVLRMGFPEWTVWALPFVQNEFGHVFVKRRGLANPEGGPESTLLADALATVITGPAYACAALLLRLDPRAVMGPRAEETLRSATILVTLQQIAAALPNSPLGSLVDRLQSEWREAVKSGGGDLAAYDSVLAAPETTELAERARGEILDEGGGGELLAPEWAARWATVNEWAGQLKNNQADSINPSEVADATGDRPVVLSLLLDAAWLARVGVIESEDAPMRDVDMIAQGAIAKMLDVVRPEVRSNSGDRGSRRNR